MLLFRRISENVEKIRAIEKKIDFQMENPLYHKYELFKYKTSLDHNNYYKPCNIIINDQRLRFMLTNSAYFTLYL